MQVWIDNIGNWFNENAAPFLMWLQSIDFAGLIASIILLIKQAFATKTNTKNVKALNDTLRENAELKAALKEMTEQNRQLSEQVATFNSKLSELVDGNDKITTKVNAALDVYSLVYQTIKNEDTRAAVNNILNNARYNETLTRQELTKQIEEMQATVEQFMKDTHDKVDDVAAHSKLLSNGITVYS